MFNEDAHPHFQKHQLESLSYNQLISSKFPTLILFRQCEGLEIALFKLSSSWACNNTVQIPYTFKLINWRWKERYPGHSPLIAF